MPALINPICLLEIGTGYSWASGHIDANTCASRCDERAGANSSSQGNCFTKSLAPSLTQFSLFFFRFSTLCKVDIVFLLHLLDKFYYRFRSSSTKDQHQDIILPLDTPAMTSMAGATAPEVLASPALPAQQPSLSSVVDSASTALPVIKDSVQVPPSTHVERAETINLSAAVPMGKTWIPSKSSITARNLCALDWVSKNVGGTSSEFAGFWNTIKNTPAEEVSSIDSYLTCYSLLYLGMENRIGSSVKNSKVESTSHPRDRWRENLIQSWSF